MKLLSKILLVFILAITVCKAKAQYGPYDTLTVYAMIINGDTLPAAWMPDASVRGVMPEKWKKYWKEWTRLRNAVYVTYPYAMAASKVFNEVNSQLVNVTDKSQRKAIIKSREKELKKEFADKLMNLSVYQGKVLMKLIYRQTGNNCYEIIQEYKGGFSAGFWQTIAILFGSNLKQTYEPQGKDKVMEDIVLDVERMYGHRT